MFRGSLIETSRATTAHRGWATFVSFCLETAGIGVLVLVPLIYTDALPALHFGDGTLAPPTAPRSRGPIKPVTELVAVPEQVRDSAFRAPIRIPTGAVPVIRDRDLRPPALSDAVTCDPCVEGAIPVDDANGRKTFLTELLKPKPFTAMPKPMVPKLIRVSRMDPGMIIARVEPRYPDIAIKTRTQGQVMLVAVIGRDGRIQNLRVVSGHPLLMQAAVEAVRQWRYRPTMLNGQPVEVETQITVNFTLN